MRVGSAFDPERPRRGSHLETEPLHQVAMIFGGLLEQIHEIHSLLVKLDLASGDAGDIQQIVDQVRHVVGLTLDDFPHFVSFLAVGPEHPEHLDTIDDSSQGVAELVAEHRQEFVLPPRDLPQRLFDPLAFRDVTDVALNSLMMAFLIDVADEFHLPMHTVRVFEWQVLIADVAHLLQFGKSRFAQCDVPKQADLPQFLPREVLFGIAQQLTHEGVGVLDSPRVGIEDQDTILSGFEHAAIAHLRFQSALDVRRV